MLLEVTAHSVSFFLKAKSTVGRVEDWGGGGELREAMKACDSCREGWKGNHVVIRNMIVKKHSEPSCEMDGFQFSIFTPSGRSHRTSSMLP